MEPVLLEDAAQVLMGSNINISTAAVSMTLLVLEFFSTLELEIAHIWFAPWTLMKVLYFANRLLPFVFLPISILYDVVPRPSPSTLALTSTTLLCLFIAQGSWGPSPFDSIVGCVQRASSGMILVVIGFCVLLYSGLVAMCLSVYFGIKVYWASRKTNRLIKVFYEDGTYYFISLAVMALINVVGALCLPTRFQSLVGRAVLQL
ncbi:hypothetical protein BKA70DRAFT_1429257 [Coprinopsis sp. MPI-PUGE-AT-0042]|nr:hypothetical protein BKA70DRAFT_1429257 [Coprinopsis sp. MPI-PUGE-AT-0042]